MLYLKAVFFLFFCPGMAYLLVPYLLLKREGHRFDIGDYRMLGLIPMAAGVAVLLWCVWDFATYGRGTLAPIDPPKKLVQRGLYGLVRNPMYVGGLLILLGETIFFESWGILLWMLLAAFSFHLFVVHYEEPTLRKKFGHGYDEYLRSVPRWLPRFRP